MKKVILFILGLLFIICCNSVSSSNNQSIEINNNIEKKQKNIIYDYNENVSLAIDNEIVIDKDSFSFSIADYKNDFYKVSNYSFNEDYYVSLGDEYISENTFIVGLVLIPKQSTHMFFCKNVSRNHNVLEILYENDGQLYISFKNVQDDLLQYIDCNSFEISNISDDSEISNRILDVLNHERQYLLSQISLSEVKLRESDYEKMIVEQERSVYNPCNYANTVSFRQFDNYTSNLGALNIFLGNENARDAYKVYWNNSLHWRQATDTLIASIIPRQLFVNEGIYSYIGTSYGFSIKTVESYGNYTSNFIIFVIEQEKKSVNSFGLVKVRAVFKGFVDYDGDYETISQVYDGSHLVLTNINIDVVVYNKNELNVNDDGYIPNLDNGYYISHYDIDCNAKENVVNPINLKYIRYVANVLGLIPKYGPYIKWTAYGLTYIIEGVYNSNIEYHEYTMIADPNNQGFYNGHSSWTAVSTGASSMIQTYGKLIKGVNANITNVDLSPDVANLYYDVNEYNYFSVSYGFSQANSTIANDSIIETKVSLDIRENNSLSQKIDCVTNSWAEEYNQNRTSSTHTIKVDTSTEVEYSYDGYQIYNFTPISTGVYDIETYGSNYDTVLELYFNNSFITDDDNNGLYVNENNQSTCSLIRVTLTANNTYAIKVKGKSNSGGYTNLIVQRHGNNLTEQMSSTGFSTFYGYSVWQYFTPTRSDIFDIFTVDYNDLTDTYIELYDSNHNLIAFSDSYDGCSHGKISLYLEEGETYIIKTKHMGNEYSERSFGVVIIREEEIYEYSSNMFYYTSGRIEKGDTDVIVYAFKPKYNTTYKFYTEYSSGKKDVVMYLFDRDFNQIDYNDDGNGDLQPLISYNCVYYKTYYIMIKHYSSSNSEWTWFDFFVEET